MAIRDDFTAGEVLAAADLNDTFAEKIPYAYGTATPTTTVEGFIWYDENSTPPEPKFWDGAAFQAVSAPGGLVHIATESFSAVSSVSVNGCFTSTYENYKIVISSLTASTASGFRMRMRVAGSDNSAASYNTLGRVTASLSSGDYNVSAATYFEFGGLNSGFAYATTMELQSPQLAQNTNAGFNHAGRNSVPDGQCVFGGMAHYVSTAFDGFSLFPNTGTITGTIRIYGYLNS
jgi:hypothetical protein